MNARRYACAFGLAIAMCRGALAAPATTQASAPATQPAAVAGLGFSDACPCDWKLIAKTGDYAMDAVPSACVGGDDDPVIAIEVPVLPMHIPGMIPIGPVTSGYVSDLKKKHPDLAVDERVATKLDGASARRVSSSFQIAGKTWRDLAVLAVHGDHVYVISGDCEASAFDKTKAAFDAVVAAWQWNKK